MNDQTTDRVQLRDPSALGAWMRTFVGIECFILAALAALGVCATLLLSYVVRVETSQLETFGLIIGYVQIANVFFFLGGAYFITWLVHRMVTNAHVLAPDRVKLPADGIGGRLSLILSFIQSPMPLARLWRSAFGTAPSAEARVPQINWCWRLGVAAVLAIVAARALRAFHPVEATSALPATALSTLGYALGAVCAALLVGIFRRLVKAQQLLVRRAAMAS